MRIVLALLAGIAIGMAIEGPVFMAALAHADDCESGPVCRLAVWWAHDLQDY